MATTKTTKRKRKSKAGRPTKLTDETRKKIEEAAALDCSIEEICFYAGISRDTLARWRREDKAFSDRIEDLRNTPVLAARQRVVIGVTENYNNAMDYLKRKRKAEFEDTGTIKHELPQPLLAHVLTNNSATEDSGPTEED